jgi:TetR/AcrR family transcriptional repressor of nem operon
MAKVTAKQKTIEAAQQLMTSNGYSATTVDEIINLAGVSKGSVYHSFKSKEELAITALEDYERKGWEIVSNGPYVKEKDPVKRAISFTKHIEKKSPELWAHGCLLGSMSLEVVDRHPALHDRIDELFKEFEEGIAKVFSPAIKQAGVRSVTGAELARHMLAVIEGGIITAKSHRQPKYLPEGLRNFRRYLEMLLGTA